MIIYSPYSQKTNITLSGIGYYFSADHICAIYQDKILKFDDVGVLSLSLNGGRTFPITLDVTGVCNIITRAKFYSNGNVMWANQTKCYYSSDNLTTYHESTVIGIDGNAFVPSTYQNFFNLIYKKPVIVNGIEIDVWGNYSIETGTQFDNINAWYTIDGGVTIKSCFKQGVSLNGQKFRHVHAVNYNDADGYFVMQTGDGNLSPAEGGNNTPNCIWDKGVYNWGNDTWTWTNICTANYSDPKFSMGVYFHNGYATWAGDYTKKIWRESIAKLLATPTDETTYQTLLTGDNDLEGLFGDSDGVLIVSEWLNKKLFISQDHGDTWTTYTLTGGPTLDSSYGFGSYYCGQPKNNDGYYRFEVFAQGEEYRAFTKGSCLMVRIK